MANYCSMKMKIIVCCLLFSFAFLSYCIMVNYKDDNSKEVKYEQIELNEQIFPYENLVFKDYSLTSFLIKEQCNESLFFSLPYNDTLLNRIKRINCEEKVCSAIKNFEVIKRLYCTFTKGDSILYCGKVKLSHDFSSFMFMVKCKERLEPIENEIIMQCINRKVFLINMKNDTITSVAPVFGYSCLDDDVAYSHIYLENSRFCYCLEYLSSDVILPPNLENESVPKYYFGFDKFGRIVKE